MDNFLILAVTRPDFYKEEASEINNLLKDGLADYVHIRKPDASLTQIKELISHIDAIYHPRLKIHDHFNLLEFFNLGGIHLNSRNKSVFPNANSISISIHSLEEIENVDEYDYFFISPVFDSISKNGYKAAFNMNALAEKVKGKKAIALGGVTPDKFLLLSSIGFSGAAMLGYFFPINKN